MGTRADFYIGIGPQAEWLGSISYDGYPDGAVTSLVATTSEEAFRAEASTLANGDTGTNPKEGWPWPWKDSRTTDFAYAWHEGRVVVSRFGDTWVRLDLWLQYVAECQAAHTDGAEEPPPLTKPARLTDAEVRDMSTYKADGATMWAKSGLMILGSV